MIAILDYDAGNLTSVRLAFERLGVEVAVTKEVAVAKRAEKVVFPGVGSAGSGMEGLRRYRFDGFLKEAFEKGTPILGICLGMQMLFERSEEDGGVEGLGLLKGEVRSFLPHKKPGMKIPHMGWNGVRQVKTHPLFEGIAQDEAFYFVHSYYAASETLGETEYEGVSFTSVSGKGNLFATQFHPERSGEAGLQLLRNFTTWEGSRC